MNGARFFSAFFFWLQLHACMCVFNVYNVHTCNRTNNTVEQLNCMQRESVCAYGEEGELWLIKEVKKNDNNKIYS